MVTPAKNVSRDEKLEFFRHALATLAYRGGKVIRDVPAEFASFRAADGARTPVEILSHMGDLLDWMRSIAEGKERWSNASPQSWNEEVNRFHDGLKSLDDYLASGGGLAVAPEALFQGPVADALTHVRQLAILRRMAGFPIKGENYFKADIVAGRVGPEQAAPKREF